MMCFDLYLFEYMDIILFTAPRAFQLKLGKEATVWTWVVKSTLIYTTTLKQLQKFHLLNPKTQVMFYHNVSSVFLFNILKQSDIIIKSSSYKQHLHYISSLYTQNTYSLVYIFMYTVIFHYALGTDIQLFVNSYND